MSTPKISIITPVHEMQNRDFFMDRLECSLEKQNFQNFEHIITTKGLMAENTNSGIKMATGEIVKILFLDDFLWSKDALQHIVDAFAGKEGWYASGCVHTEDGTTFVNPHEPEYSYDIQFGNNTIGSPSVLAFSNKEPFLFDENLSWLLDCDLYYRLHLRYGEPMLNPSLDVAIGLGTHQTSNIMHYTQKDAELAYMHNKYAETN